MCVSMRRRKVARRTHLARVRPTVVP
jgi:hypothetical protein